MSEVAIIGDRFMLPEIFRQKLEAVAGTELILKSQCNPWPGEPLVHGHDVPGMDGLKEYFGDDDSVVDFIGDAEILVTHLAPMSRDMLSRLPTLRLIVVSRGGPVNINLAACRERDVLVVHTPGRNASAVAEFTIGAILTEGSLGAAVIETFTVEPVPKDSPVLNLPNVILTPHIAGASVLTVAFAAEQAAEEVRRFLAGEAPINPQ